MQKSFDKSSLENQNLGSLKTKYPISRVTLIFYRQNSFTGVAMLLNVSISDDLSRVMAVSANRKAQAGFISPERAPPPLLGHSQNL